MELSLGIAIFNKFCGLFGLLALFTGHPLDILQWLFYLWSFVTLLVYLHGLMQIYQPRLAAYCLVLVVYSTDTILTCLYTLWFTRGWFIDGDVGVTATAKEDDADATQGSVTVENEPVSHQSASKSYEYAFTMAFTLFALSLRFYSNFLIASFVQRMFQHNKFAAGCDDVEQDLKHKSVAYRAYAKMQRWCYFLCRRYL